MFTLAQIKEAHSRVRSGVDFPQYIKELSLLGVVKYSIYVYDGHAEYIGEGDYTIHSTAEYLTLHIEPEVDIDRFKNYLKAHQEGKTDYLTFCQNSAESGIDKWVVDIRTKTCTYYDKSGSFVLVENISI